MTTPFGGQPAPQPGTPFGGSPAPAQPAAAPFGSQPDPYQQPPPTPQQAFGGQQAPAPSGDPWSKPSEITADGFPAKDLIGALLLFTPKEHRQGLTTAFTKPGETTDMVVCDVAVIGATNASGAWAACPPEQSTVLSDAGVFQGKLIAKLKGKIGQGMVLGRLYIGQATTGNPPYELADPTDADMAAARAFYAAHQPRPPF